MNGKELTVYKFNYAVVSSDGETPVRRPAVGEKLELLVTPMLYPLHPWPDAPDAGVIYPATLAVEHVVDWGQTHVQARGEGSIAGGEWLRCTAQVRVADARPAFEVIGRLVQYKPVYEDE